jgi:hypothetical protein
MAKFGAASKACLDLLNDSIEDLPDEGWEMLSKYLPREAGQERDRRQPWRFWRGH